VDSEFFTGFLVAVLVMSISRKRDGNIAVTDTSPAVKDGQRGWGSVGTSASFVGAFQVICVLRNSNALVAREVQSNERHLAIDHRQWNVARSSVGTPDLKVANYGVECLDPIAW
jgi:hypothetical protein